MNRIFAAALALLPLLPTAAYAYTPNWLACDGDVTITPAGRPATKETVHEVYVTDDDARNLFKYSIERKSLGLEGVTAYSPQEVRWAGTGSGMDLGTWEGRLDRATGALRMTYKSAAETRVWSETCKPTGAQPEEKL